MPDAEGFVAYRAVGGPMPVLLLSARENVEFVAPWGEPMRIKGNGVLIDGGGADVYGIQPEEFAATYAPCIEDGAFIPKGVWDACYRAACDDARDTAWHIRKSPTQAAVEHAAWEMAVARLRAPEEDAGASPGPRP